MQKLFADFLPGKVCVITGGGRGVGQAIAEKYAAEGFTLILTARSKDQLEEVWKEAFCAYLTTGPLTESARRKLATSGCCH